MKRYSCEFCNQDIVDYKFVRIMHTVTDVFFMCLFIIKLLSWMFFQSFKLKNIRNFPCKCTHKAFWHLTMPKGFNLPVDKLNWSYLLFSLKLIPDEILTECLKCMLSIDSEYKCYEFAPINNLTYLENIYKKK